MVDAPSTVDTPSRNLALELVRVTEAAAVASAEWIGRGDSDGADKAAVDAMRTMLSTVEMRGTVIIGEGEKDQAPMLFNGEEVGQGVGDAVDIAVDPLEGTTLCATGRPNSISIIAVANAGTIFNPGPAVYMDKIVVGRSAVGAVDLDASPRENVHRVADALGKRPREVSVYLLDRDRHAEMIADLRSVGARVHLLTAGDTAPAIAAAGIGEADVDLVMGVGGSPEAVIVAAAMRCLGGEIQARLWPRTDAERESLTAAGYDLDRLLTTSDLVGGDDVFVAATGITSGQLLRGVRETPQHVVTDSIVMRSRTGTWRRIEAHHSPDKHVLLVGRRLARPSSPSSPSGRS
jgi:fructose-1,6-bisphosphatase II